MENLVDLLLANPQILMGIAAFLLFIAIVSIIKKLLKFGIIILIVVILVGAGGISVKNTQEKYNLSYHENIITATVEGKQVNLDFNKLEGAKVAAQKTDSGMRLSITYKNGNKDEVVIPNFLYQLVKLKVQPVELNLNNGG